MSVTKNQRNNGDAYVFVANRIAMRLLSIWPLQNDNLFSKIRWFLATMSQFILVVILTFELLLNCEEEDDSFESIMLLVSGIMSSVKATCMRIYLSKLAETLQAACDDWSSVSKTSDLYKIMKRYGNVGRLVSIGQLSFGTFGTFFYISATIVLGKGRPESFSNLTISQLSFAFPVTCTLGKIIDINHYFLPLIAIQTSQMYTLALMIVSVDTFFFNITMHLCGQFDFLRQQFSQFGKYEITEQDRRKKLKVLVNTHDRLMKLAKNLQDTLNSILLTQITLSAIVMGMGGFRLIEAIAVHDVSLIVKGIVSANFIGIEAFVYSYAGDSLHQASENIIQGIYECNWYELSPRLVRDLTFIMMRISHMPVRFTGGNIFYITRSTMVDIFRTSASYISLLRATS